MATYKKEKGFAVQTLSSDTAASIVETGSWSSGGALNTARGQIAGFGNTSAAGAAMGTTGSVVTSYEQYNGSSWTETTDINTAGRNGLGTGTTTAGLVYGGWPRAGKTESWNGSAWTEVGDMTRGANGSQSQGGGGTQTAAFAAGGEPGTSYSQLAEIWDGSSWTEVNDLNTLRQAPMGFGITTNGYIAGGYSPPLPSPYLTDNVEVYNGSSWTETTNFNSKRGVGGGAGNATSGIIFGGQTPSASALTEFWDGSSWTEVGDLGTARYQAGKTVNPSSGSTDAMFIGGEVPSYVAVTEEWTVASTLHQINLGQVYFNKTANAFKVTATSVPGGTWASGGALNTGKEGSAGAGTQTAGIVAAGYTGGSYTPTATTEQYNGTSWTEVNDLNTATASGGMAHNSPYTDTVFFGGLPAPSASDQTEVWNGSNWTEVNEMNTGRYGTASFGNSGSSAQAAGGQSGPGSPAALALSEQWNGSSWTEVNDLNSPRRYQPGAGVLTAAIVIGGDTDQPGFPGGRYTARVESWDGTSFTEVGDLNTGGAYRGSAGTQTQAIAFGGGAPSPYVVLNEAWNGTSWTEINDMSQARRAWNSGIGQSATAGMAAGGGGPSAVLTATEEFTGTTANSTITLS